MGVSVVIPCLNEEKYIAACLDGLINNGFDATQLEILVVDGGSTDQTLVILNEFIQKYPFVRIIPNVQRVTPVALNLGLKHSKNNRILIAGAHAIYPENYINSLNALLDKPEVDAAGGVLQTKVKNSNPKTEAICFVLSHPFGVGNSIFRIGAKKIIEVDTVPFGLYEKSIFSTVGNYNERLIRNHDMELSSRIKAAGYKIWMDPNLVCTYFARETLTGLAQNNYLNGFWNLKTLGITKKFSSLGLRHYIPLLFVLSLIIPVVAVPILGVLILFVSAFSLFLYLLLILYISFRARGVNKIYILFAFLTLHFSYGVGSLMGGLALIKFWK